MRVVRILVFLVLSVSFAGCFVERCEWNPEDASFASTDASTNTEQ